MFATTSPSSHKTLSQIFTGRVRDLSFQGMGVVDHPEGPVFFVAGAWPGDEGEFEILESQKRYGFARLLRLIQSSPDRIAPPCTHQGFTSSHCGGCPWMMIDYSAQLKAKQKMLSHQLERAGLSTQNLRPIHASPKIFGYRNRAQFKTNGERLGYMAFHHREIVDVKTCSVLNSENQTHLANLRQTLPNNKWTPQGSDTWNFLEVDDELSATDLVKLNQRRPFKQANPNQNLWMQSWLREKLFLLSKPFSGIELFCGSGNFTQVLLEAGVSSLVGAEVSAAILQLKNEATPQLQLVQGDLLRPSTWNKIRSHLRNPDLLFLDPPREGFLPLQKFVKTFPSLAHILYVSCDPRSFVRELKLLTQEGFEIQEIQPVDQLPHTPHLEVLGYLSRGITRSMFSQSLQ